MFDHMEGIEMKWQGERQRRHIRDKYKLRKQAKVEADNKSCTICLHHAPLIILHASVISYAWEIPEKFPSWKFPSWARKNVLPSQIQQVRITT